MNTSLKIAAHRYSSVLSSVLSEIAVSLKAKNPPSLLFALSFVTGMPPKPKIIYIFIFLFCLIVRYNNNLHGKGTLVTEVWGGAYHESSPAILIQALWAIGGWVHKQKSYGYSQTGVIYKGLDIKIFLVLYTLCTGAIGGALKTRIVPLVEELAFDSETCSAVYCALLCVMLWWRKRAQTVL